MVKKIFICLLVMIALLSAPVAHAAGFFPSHEDCPKILKYEDGKATKADVKADDHCCAHNISYIPISEAKSFTVSLIAPAAIQDDEKASTFIAGPPLKPPSHA